MKSEKSKFFAVWKIVFKILFYVSFFVATFKVFLFWLHNGKDDLKLVNVVMTYAVYIAGAALMASIISVWGVVKNRGYQQ